MNAVGIDVSKGHSTVAVVRHLGEIVASPFEVSHTEPELSKLIQMLKELSGETKIIMESTGSYHLPIANALHEAGLHVIAVNPQLTKDGGKTTIRKDKTDSIDSLGLANYLLSHWLSLSEYIPGDDVRRMLKVYSRQYNKYIKLKTMLKNNLISLTDQTFPGVNELFASPARKSDGHEKWIDFTHKFWHCECVCSLTPRAFEDKYRRFCKSNNYYFTEAKAEDLYMSACAHFGVMSKNETTKTLITNAIAQVNAISESIAIMMHEMIGLASSLPEYGIVMDFYGVGETLGTQLIAEIGNVYRYQKKSSLVRFAGLEPVANSSGKYHGKEKISKQGSPHIRRTLFLVMDCILKTKPIDDPVYQFLDRKRSENKPYRSYMCAGSAKFLRMYYSRVKACLDKYYSE